MPFLNLDNNWSKLAPLYNQNFNGKPTVPRKIEQYVPFDDGLVRGGVINAAISSVKDVLRIGKFYISPRGASFLIKQVGLQLSNPQLETKVDNPQRPTSGNNYVKNTLNKLSNFLNNNQTRTYNLGLNTLTQVGVEAAGLHIVRHGKLPKFVSEYNYEKITTDNNNLQGTKINPTPTQNYIESISNTNRLVNYLSILNLDSTGPIALQNYLGGPDSTYGIGRTIIKTTNIRTTINDTDLGSKTITSNRITSNQFGLPSFTQEESSSPSNPNLLLKLNRFTPLTNSEIQIAETTDLTSPLKDQLDKSPRSYNKEIASKNIESRIGTSHSGMQRKVDSINVINITDSKTFYKTLVNKANSEVQDDKVYDDEVKGNIDGTFGRDVIKFRLEFLNNDAPIVDQAINTDVLAFRAYIDNFDDGMTARWNSYRYMGRGEEFFVYDGFTRDINVAFTIFSHTKEEMKPIYKKLNYLLSTFTPDYANNKMRGNIGYLTVGDYLYRQPGVFTDIKLGNMLDTHWEINLDGDQYELPKYIKVTMSFKPIHTFLPRKAKYGGDGYNTPFITPDKVAYPDYTNKINKYLD